MDIYGRLTIIRRIIVTKTTELIVYLKVFSVYKLFLFCNVKRITPTAPVWPPPDVYIILANKIISTRTRRNGYILHGNVYLYVFAHSTNSTDDNSDGSIRSILRYTVFVDRAQNIL